MEALLIVGASVLLTLALEWVADRVHWRDYMARAVAQAAQEYVLASLMEDLKDGTHSRYKDCS